MSIELNSLIEELKVEENSVYLEEIAALNERNMKLESFLNTAVELLKVSDELLDVDEKSEEITAAEHTEFLEDRILFTRDYLSMMSGLLKSMQKL